MKLCLQILTSLVLTASAAFAQWVEIAPYEGPPTDGGIAFVIDGEGYFGGGPGSDDFYKYNPDTGTWTQLADLGGGPRGWAWGFTIDGKGYVGGGDPDGSFSPLSDMWEYDPATDSWTEVASFPGGPRDGMFCFVLDGVAYLGCGFSGTNILSDVWQYLPSTDTWSYLGEYPGGPVIFPVSFVIGDEAYVGLGKANDEVATFYKFNPTTVTWTPLPNYPGGARQAAVAFAADGKGYVGGGLTGPYNTAAQHTSFYSYDPQANTWAEFDDFPIENASWSSAFVIDDIAYVGSGVEVPVFQFTDRFFKYVFTSLLESDLPMGTIDFGDVPLGTQKDYTFTVRNAGAKPLNITAIEVAIAGMDVFDIALPALPYELAPGAELELTATFDPQDAMLYESSLRFTTDAGNGPTHDFILRGTGTELLPGIDLSRSSLSFGQRKVGTTHEMSFDITNTGEAPLTVQGLFLENDPDDVFTLLDVNPPFTIQPSASETITLEFAPNAAKDFGGRIVINSDASNGSQKFLTVSGKGIQQSRIIELTLSTIDMGDVIVGETGVKMIDIMNTGEADLTLSEFALTGPEAPLYSVDSDPLPITIPPGNGTTVTLSFMPDAVRVFDVGFVIRSDATNEPELTVPTTGRGVAAPESDVTIDITTIDFGNVDLSEMRDTIVTIRSTGTAALEVSAATITGDAEGAFAVTGGSFPMTITPGESADLTVAFQAVSLGEKTATLTVATNAPGSASIDIPLRANAIDITSIGDLPTAASIDLRVYPNPLQRGAVLHYTINTDAPFAGRVQLTNLLGETIYNNAHTEIHPGTHAIDFGARVPAGMYLLNITGAPGSSAATVPIIIVE